ncbi:hypothetical protein [Mesorhizobium sp. M2C.T.Ca.TU.002.02.1.1]|uniref:hypothetical protein n=1 Tax=Mesorhizobium sp. M2C.T.Ca.TU.002.02.1.1 TaxID=2496788 RepID=UPI000FCB3049|nr:hypothetical protein [Mesorhizobium sp. M2C.T.Ca.TU.002.02.1.1]RUU59443.1 hypothetical protein EOD07_07050 [Mesorhizobium sp. M2C.T.Ca.TU.002.02.1.1]RUU71589.1 hypothetical protein EOD04_02185 [Mesorhizobium sp. M2C.T.Ca.TU.009.01.2.1]
MPKPINENDVAARITPQSIHWRDTAALMHWQDLKGTVDAARSLVLAVDEQCRAVESDSDLSPEGRARRRVEIAQKAMADFAAFKPLAKAESSVAKALSIFESKMTSLPKKPDHVADVMLAQEIRAHVAKQSSPANYVLSHLSDPAIVGAVLNAPGYLTGLANTDLVVIRERAASSLHPEETKRIKEASEALEATRQGIEAAKRMILERCDARHDRDNVIRSKQAPISPLTRPAVAAE